MESTGGISTACFDCSTTDFPCFFPFYKSQIYFLKHATFYAAPGVRNDQKNSKIPVNILQAWQK